MLSDGSSDFLTLRNVFPQYSVDNIILISFDSWGLCRLSFRRGCRVVTLSTAGEEGSRGRCGGRGVGGGRGGVVVVSYVFEPGGGSCFEG